jgi:hypothetical protein
MIWLKRKQFWKQKTQHTTNASTQKHKKNAI